MINKLDMEQSLYATLQLACCLLAIVVVAWLVMKYLTTKCSATEKESADKRCHIHLCYLIGIGALLLIELVSFILTHTGGFSRIIFDQISLAATISSILLSVVAIIYSIVSGTNGANLYVKTEEVSKQIGETLPKFAELGRAVTDLKEIPSSIAQHLGELKEQLKRMEELSSGVSHKIDSMAGEISAMSEPLTSVFNGGRSIAEDHVDGDSVMKGRHRNSLEQIFRYYIKNSSAWGVLILLACCYSERKKKPIVLTDELFRAKVFPSAYMLGYLVASRALGIIKIESMDSKTVQIASVSKDIDVKQEVHKALKEAVAKRDDKDSARKILGGWVNDVQAYFEVDDDEIEL